MTSPLLINEPPLQVLPTLAERIGLNEAIVLQQIHYWIANPKIGLEHDGKRWVRNSLTEWHEGNFKFWSLTTVRRTLESLLKIGVLVKTCGLNDDKYDHTLWYSIDYDKLNEQIDLSKMNKTAVTPSVTPEAEKPITTELSNLDTSSTESLSNTNTNTDSSKELSYAELHAAADDLDKRLKAIESQVTAATQGKSEEPPSSAPPPKVRKQRKPRAPSPRDPLFNLVAKHVFGLDQVNGEGKKVGNFQKQLLEHIFGPPPYDPLRINGLVADLDGMWTNWAASHPGLHKPCKLDSIGRGLKDYRDSLKVGANGHNATAPAHKPNYGF